MDADGWLRKLSCGTLHRVTATSSSDEGLNPGELEPIEGGTWDGLLFDNPRIGIESQLTWSFRFPFSEVTRDYGSSNVFLDVEWLALTTPSWRSMAAQIVRGATDPAEASVYFFEHHRYDLIDLEIVEQQDVLVRCRTTLSGDLDGLGLEQATAEAWLRFAGITVSLTDTASAEDALSRLRTFTDTSCLSCQSTGSNGSYRFTPVDG